MAIAGVFAPSCVLKASFIGAAPKILEPYPLAAPGGIVKIASPKVSHRIAANLRVPSAPLAGLPQAPETSFRTVASEWVTPHFLRLPETLAVSLQVLGCGHVRACSCISNRPQPF